MDWDAWVGDATDAIRGTPAGIMVLRAMKAERTNQLLEDPVWDEELMLQIPIDIYEMLMRFMMNAEVDKTGLKSRVNLIQSKELKATTMTLAQEGRQKSRQEVLREILIEALELRFSHVPAGLREEIDSISDASLLLQLLRTSLQCPSIEAFRSAL